MLFCFSLSGLLAANASPLPTATPTALPFPTSPPPALGAGFRYSTYGPDYDPGPQYWVDVGQQMAGRFPGAVPEALWIVSNYAGAGTVFAFPGRSDNRTINYMMQDRNEEALSLFAQAGVCVWLQVEPGGAPAERLIDIMLDQYHLFLKHWEQSMLPPTLRLGLVFVDDSQQFESLDQMVAEFTEWGNAFAPAPVAFQFGYPADQKWWGKFDDPARTIGEAILKSVPNTQGLYWIDFTVLQVFKR